MTETDQHFDAEDSPAVASPSSDSLSHPRWLIPILLFIIMLIGLFVRVENLSCWRANSDTTFFDGKPLLGALDGYYYLRMARDLLEHTYAAHDVLRNAPDGYPRPTPPMLSCLAAGVCRATGWQLDWIGLLLPAVLGTLVAIPLFAFGRYLFCATAGIASAAAGLVAPYVVYRGGMGWFDTDCMNVTWTLATAYCFMRFSHDTSARRHGWLLAGLAFTGLFLWWWDQATGAALVISLLPLAIGLGFFYRPRRRAEWVGLALLTIALLALGTLRFHWLRDHLGNWFALAQGQIHHVTKQPDGDLPKFAYSITEQGPPSFDYVVDATTRSLTIFILSTLGFLLLALHRAKAVVFLLPTLALAILSITYAERFLIFLAPLLALGFGYLVGGLWRLHRLHRGFAVVAVGTAGLALFPPLHTLLTAATAWPKTDASRVAGMVRLAELTPTNAVVWTWWDNGYAINYFARRATISDGQIHGSGVARYTAAPLAATNPALAARFMQFYASNGQAGIRKIDAGGDDQTATLQQMERALSESTAQPPVYLYLDSLMMNTAETWFSLAGLSRPENPFVYRPMFDIAVTPQGIFDQTGNLIIDLDTGILKTGDTFIGLEQLVVREAEGAWSSDFPRSDGGHLEIQAPRGFGVLMSPEVAESVFNRLFVRLDPRMGTWFDPVLNQSPKFQIWKVLPP